MIKGCQKTLNNRKSCELLNEKPPQDGRPESDAPALSSSVVVRLWNLHNADRRHFGRPECASSQILKDDAASLI